MALDKRPYRKAHPDRVKALRRVSTECERLVLIHLQRGRASTPTGLVDVDPVYLAVDMRTDEATVIALLREAHAAGLIVYSEREGWAYLLGSFDDDPPQAPNNWKGYRSEVMRAPACAAQDAALAELGTWDSAWHPGSYSVAAPSKPRPNPVRTPSPLPDPDPDPDPSLAPPALVPQGTANPTLPLEHPKPDKPQPVNLIALYNEHCPSLARCQGRPGSAAERKALAAWKREPDESAWVSRFQRVESSPHCTGQNERGWKADLLWILDASNVEKVDLGRYDRRVGTGPPGRHARGNAPDLTDADHLAASPEIPF